MKLSERKIIAAAFSIPYAGWAIYILYAEFTYSGLWRLASGWEASVFSALYPKLTFLALIAGGLCLVLPVAALIETSLRALAGDDIVRDAPVAAGLTTPTGRADVSVAERKRRAKAAFALGLACIAASAATGWIAYRKSHEQIVVETVDVMHGGTHRTPHVQITAMVHPGLAVKYTMNDASSWYFPLTGVGWKERDPIVYFVKHSDNVYPVNPRTVALGQNDPSVKLTRTGVLIRNDLPGLALSALEEHGFTVASPNYVLYDDAAPDLTDYWVAAFALGALGVILVLQPILLGIIDRPNASRG